MDEGEPRSKGHSTGVSESSLSRRSFFSLVSLIPLVGLAIGVAERQAEKAERKEEKGKWQFVEVVHTRVFAAGPGGGNPCPVVLSADHLSLHEMQALSQKFGLDTVFILTPRSKHADIRLRYFVPQHEMGVSGHATVAAITVARRDGQLKSKLVQVETLNGLFRVTCLENGQQLLVTLEQNRPIFGPPVPPSMVARALGISPQSIVSKTPIESVWVSRPKLLVPLCDSRELNKLQPDFNVMWTLCDAFRVTGLYPFTRNTDKANADVEARQFPLRAGFPEDAATGVAAAALGAYLVKYDHQCSPGTHRIRIAQGYAMGSPSLIEVLIDCKAGKITKTAIRGEAEIIRQERIPLR